MKKATRTMKAWSRKKNWPHYFGKGVYFCMGPARNWMTPRQVWRWLRKESLQNPKTKKK